MAKLYGHPIYPQQLLFTHNNPVSQGSDSLYYHLFHTTVWDEQMRVALIPSLIEAIQSV